jgi:competence protein ComEC
MVHESTRKVIHLPDGLLNTPLEIKGKISSVPITIKCLTRFKFKLDKNSEFDLLPKEISLSWYHCRLNLKVNQRIHFWVKLRPSMGKYGLNYYGSVLDKYPVKYGRISRSTLQSLREFLYLKLQRLTRNKEHAAIVSALTLGIKDYYFNQLKPVFIATGTTHLFAISGLHVGLILAMTFFSLRFLLANLLSWFHKERLIMPICYLFTTLCIIFYCELSGLSVPTMRAGLMVLIAFILALFRRNMNASYVLMLTVLFCVLLDPRIIHYPSAWLSFSAVAVIVLSMNYLSVQLNRFVSLLLLQWVLFIGLLPITLYCFHQWVLLAPLVNLIVVPYVSLFVLPLSLLCLCLPFPLAAYLAHWILTPLITFMMHFLNAMAVLKWARLYCSFSGLQLLLSLMIVFFLLLPLGRACKAVLILLFILVLAINIESIPLGKAKITMLDVGQGLSMIIRTTHHSLLFDTGPSFYSGGDSLQRVVLPFLEERGINSLDAVVISHGDDDHIGGYESLLNSYRVKKVYTSDAVKLPIATPCLRGEEWEWDGVHFEFLYPDKDFLDLGNNSSCVLKVTSEHERMLLTGDIEDLAEAYLIRYQSAQLSSTILQVPHHGSRSSSSLNFIRLIHPKMAWISLAKYNHYGFPNQTVLKRYQGIGAELFLTSESGAISGMLN